MRPSRFAKRCAQIAEAQCKCQHLHHRPRRQLQSFQRPAALPFSTSIPRPGRRKPKYKSLSAEEYQKKLEEHAVNYPAYTEAEKKALAVKYTPEQMAAIEVGEVAVSTEDLITQGRVRNDHFAFEYLSDFATIDPVVDKRISRLRGDGDDDDKTFGLAADGDIEDPDEKLERIMEALIEPDADRPPDAFDIMWAKFQDDPSSVEPNQELVDTFLDQSRGEAVHEDQTEDFINDIIARQPGLTPDVPQAADPSIPIQPLLTDDDGEQYSAATANKLMDILAYDIHPDPPTVAPTLPLINDPSISWADAETFGHPEDADIDEDTRAMYSLLSRQTGLSITALRRFRTRVLVTHRVVNQTRLGKIDSIYVLTVAGNGNGLLGLGEGKATEPEDARRAAVLAALRNMRPVLRYEQRTIFGAVRGKSGAVRLELSARPPGFGVRAQHLIFEMARVAGITDLAGRVGKARNKMNVAKAAWKALLAQRDPEDLARARGKKFVDVRKVYYAGKV